ncbi:FadR/GntR family transcriptional regulator [Paenibacillus sp. N3.4]|uniref:FadR/GntR family transcriptional regulator n=1 Tax=Paenibacillus sp. N3.4 TaxID=2603222 RepID=UPI0021C321CF|nr:FCD domain-containing protein [Paenibacillus sp. N3.4]
MAQFGVGRSTIREAVRVLAHAGMLEKRQGHGTFVIGDASKQEPLDYRLRRAEVLDVYEVRLILELEIAKWAAERRDEHDLEQIRNFLEIRNQALVSGDHQQYLDADVAFHLAIAAAAKNPVIVDLYRSFSNVLRTALDKLLTDPRHENNQTELHIQMYEAIRDQDPAKAMACTLNQLEGTKKELEKRLL